MRPGKTEEAAWYVSGVVKGAIGGLIIALLLLCGLALVLLWADMSDSIQRTAMDAIGGIGALAAGFLAGRSAQIKGLVHGGLAGLLFALLVLLVGIVFFGAAFAITGWLLRLIAGAVLGALGGIVGVNSAYA